MRSDPLPDPPKPQGAYTPAVCAAGLVVTAGMTPRVDGVLQYVGQVGAEVRLEDAQEAAAIAVSNATSAAAVAAGGPENLGRPMRLTVYVNAAAGFTRHTQVADGASRRLGEMVGADVTAVRSAVGVASLPGGACVEIELTFAYAGP